MIENDFHPYDPTRHSGFVMSSWVMSAHRPRWELRDLLHQPDVRCIVISVKGYGELDTPENPALHGWAAVKGDGLIWAYVRSAPGVRRQGRMVAMLAHLGLPRGTPIRCLYLPSEATGLAAAEKLGLYWRPTPTTTHKSEPRQKRNAA